MSIFDMAELAIDFSLIVALWVLIIRLTQQIRNHES